MKLEDYQQSIIPNTLNLQAVIMLVAITLIWGTTFPVIKNACDNLSPSVLIATRFTVAAVPFAMYLRNLNTQLLRDGVLLGLVLFASFATQATALETMCANKAAFIASLNAILVPLLGSLLGQRVRLRIFLAAGLALLGIGVMSWESGVLGIGELLMFGEAFIYAVYILMLEGATLRHPPLSLTAIQLWVIAVLSVVWAAPELVEQFQAVGQNFSALLYLGVVATAVTTWLQVVAQRQTSAHEVALFYTLEPVFSSVFSFWLLGEKFGGRGLVGAFLVLAAMVVSQGKGKSTDYDSELQIGNPVSEFE